MSDRLPPLTALRAFEAAARHLSFARAAAELGVTPAALSFQIKSLEEHLGQPVFRRLNRAVELTEAGRILAPGCSDGFAALGAAWHAARRSGNDTRLTITAGPGFTAKWLAPRLYDFAQAHPEIELRFSASLRLMDFDRDEVDLAIRFGQRDYDDLFTQPLLDEWMTPVAAPALAARIAAPADMLSLPLIHQDDIQFLDPPANWARWFGMCGMGQPDAAGTHFSQADHAVDAALSGAGVVLGRISLVAEHLRSGALVAPFELSLWTGGSYRIVCPKGGEARPPVAAFIDWIIAEMAPVAALAHDRRFAE